MILPGSWTIRIAVSKDFLTETVPSVKNLILHRRVVKPRITYATILEIGAQSIFILKHGEEAPILHLELTLTTMTGSNMVHKMIYFQALKAPKRELICT